jgi:hypothetical protein
MAKITQSEYEPLKAFFVAWFERFTVWEGLEPEHHPVAVLERMEKISMSKACTGLGMAIGDTLENSWDLAHGDVKAIDRDFAARGIISLSEMRRKYSRKVHGILKRGVIRNEVEYYLITGILAAMTSDAEEQVALGELIADFESKASKKKKA